MAKGGAGKGARRRHLQPRSSRPSGGVAKAEAGKQARRNMAKQARQAKQTQVVAARRAAADADAAVPPRVLVIVAAGEDAQAEAIGEQLLSHAAVADGATAATAARQRFTVLRPSRRVDSVLDAMKAGDVMVLVIPADGGLDARGEEIVDAVCMQGVGAVVGVLTGAEQLPPKQQAAARREWAASLHARFPEQAKFFSLDQDQACAALLRHVDGISPRKLTWREQRSYLLAHWHSYRPGGGGADGGADGADGAEGGDGGEGGEGLLEVEGYVRGLDLSAERLLHVPGLGDFAIESAAVVADPLRPRRGGGTAASAAGSSMEVEGGVMECDGAGMEFDEAGGGAGGGGQRLLSARRVMDREYEAEPDSLAGEQTWPTEAELAAARPAPPGARGDDDDYQRGWTGALDAESDAEDESDGEGGAAMGQAMGGYSDDDEAMDADEEAAAAEDDGAARRAYLQQRAARDEDAKFPDEVDTPVDVAARVRFARYRGLASLKSSPWHPRENLPPEYGRVFHFEHWPTLQRQALKEQAVDEPPEARAPAGSYVRLQLRVPRRFVELYGAEGGVGQAGEAAAPLVLSSLNTHENRLAVLHFTLSLTAAAEAAELVLRGKAPLVLQAGFRRYAARPIFSEDNRRSTKHKLERFVQPGRQVVATVYAPAMYAPCPLLAFLPDGEALRATPQLAGLPVASGALLSVDADRIILKRILLTGAPFRCHKKKASVRWMFFSPDDVRWFKPVELHTKFGRKGHIRSSLGTHGYMKCYFDGTMQQHDTVCMSLYKRAFPKWSGPFSYECE